MKSASIALLASLALAAPAFAQPKAEDHSAHGPAAASAAAEMSEGEVRKVDAGALKVTLKHGEIKSLDMPPMTMVFSVKDKSLLDKLKVGDKVRFKAVNESGKLTVTEVRRQP